MDDNNAPSTAPNTAQPRSTPPLYTTDSPASYDASSAEVSSNDSQWETLSALDSATSNAIFDGQALYQPDVAVEADETPIYTPTIQELPETLRPRERMAYAGPQALSTTELLAIVLRVGGRGENAIRMAERLLVHFGGLVGLARASSEELCQIHNIGPAKAAEILAAMELGKRLKAAAPEERPIVKSPKDIANLLQLEMSLLEQEHLRVVLLDTKHRISRIVTLYIGNLNTTVVRIGEIFRDPIRVNCACIVMVHNHPSGDPSPSPEDVALTKMVVDAGRLLDIEVLDHLIIGRNGFVSLKERGLGFTAGTAKSNATVYPSKP